jgi:hypothetical protein
MVSAESPICRKAVRERKFMESVEPVRARMADKINLHRDRAFEAHVRDDFCGAKSGIRTDIASQAVNA